MTPQENTESKTPIEKAIELHEWRLQDAHDTLANAFEADNGEDSDGFISRVQCSVNTLEYSLVQLRTIRDTSEYTLIAEHRLMKEAFTEMNEAFDSPGLVNDFWLRKLIKDTLKNITL